MCKKASCQYGIYIYLQRGITEILMHFYEICMKFLWNADVIWASYVIYRITFQSILIEHFNRTSCYVIFIFIIYTLYIDINIFCLCLYTSALFMSTVAQAYIYTIIMSTIFWIFENFKFSAWCLFSEYTDDNQYFANFGNLPNIHKIQLVSSMCKSNGNNGTSFGFN